MTHRGTGFTVVQGVGGGLSLTFEVEKANLYRSRWPCEENPRAAHA